jgi:hypothetical protein
MLSITAMTEGDQLVMKNMMQKGISAEKMFANLVKEMNDSISIKKENKHTNKM